MSSLVVFTDLGLGRIVMATICMSLVSRYEGREKRKEAREKGRKGEQGREETTETSRVVLQYLGILATN